MSVSTTVNWRIGQNVYFIKRTELEVICGFCEGDKEVTGKNGKTSPCPECFGSGEDWDAMGPWEVDEKDVVDAIVIRSFGVFIDGDFHTNYPEKDAFPTKALAVKEAKRRNAEKGGTDE